MKIMEIIEADLIIKENGLTTIHDLELHSEFEGVDVYIGWENILNCGIFPIIQIDDDEGNMIFYREGYENYENKECLFEWFEEMLQNYSNSDDWWHIR